MALRHPLMINIVYILFRRGIASGLGFKLALVLESRTYCRWILNAMTTFAGDAVHCIVKFGRKYDYTIPSFSVITVSLRHAIMQIEDEHGQVQLIDVFFHEDPSLEVLTPTSVKITKRCSIDVSFNTCLILVLTNINYNY